MTNDGGGSGAPRFDVVLRGYDRRQVDEHVARMQRIIGRMRADLELARSQPLPIVAPAAAGIPASDPNGRAAPRPRPRPGDAPDVVGSFTDRMQSILQSAEEEAAEIRKKAHASARSELQAARAEVADLARQREIMVTELNRLRGQLETMLSAPTAKMAPVVREGGTPAPARRDGKPRPSPKPRPGAPSPVARQAVTGPQQVSPVPPQPDPSVTAAGPTVPDEPPAAPKPTAPKPTAPKPTASKPTAPKPTAPKQTGPKPTAPKPAAPKPAANGSARNGNGKVEQAEQDPDAAPTTMVRVTNDNRGKGAPRPDEQPTAESPRPTGREERPAVEATVRVAAVRPDNDRGEKGQQAAQAEARSSRSG
jgi:hypothetical protein